MVNSSLLKTPVFEFKRLVAFFVIAFLFTWFFWLPNALAKNGVIPSSLLTELGFVGAFGPLVSALILTAVYEGKEGVSRLLKSAIDYRFSKRWWVAVVFLFPLLVIAAFLLGFLTDGVIPFSQVLADPLFLFPAFFSVLFLSGPFEEEFGWRGYALPRLQARFSAFASSLILGFLWAVWHIPQFLIPGNGMFYKTPILTFIPTVMAATILFTWVYNNTRGSLLAMLLLHTTFNLAMFTFPVLDTSIGYIYVLVVFALAATVTTAFCSSSISNGRGLKEFK